jgi:hypothetical protein
VDNDALGVPEHGMQADNWEMVIGFEQVMFLRL